MTPKRKASYISGSGGTRVNAGFRQNPKVVSHNFGGTAYIADPTKSEVRILNRTASVIWKKAARGITVKGLAAEIGQKFSVSAVTAQTDAAIFISNYLKKGLLVPVKSPKI